MSAPGVPTPGNGLVLPSMPYAYQFEGAPNGGADQGAFQGATNLSNQWSSNNLPNIGSNIATGIAQGAYPDNFGGQMYGSDLMAASGYFQNQASQQIPVNGNLAALAQAYANGTAYDTTNVDTTGETLLGTSNTLSGMIPQITAPAAGLQAEIPGLGTSMNQFGAEIAPNLAQSRSYTPYIQSALQQGFDPQSAVYNTLRQQNTDQSAANLGMTMGSASDSPYAAGVMNQSNQNFNTAWQQNLLGRMQQGASTASSLEGASSQASGRAAQDAGAMSSLAGAQSGLASSAAGLYGTAAGVGQAAAGIGQAGTGILQSVASQNLQAQQAQQQAQTQVAQAQAQDSAAYQQMSDAAAQAGLGLEQAVGTHDMQMLGDAQGLMTGNNATQQQSISDFLSYLSGGTQATAVQDQAIANLNSSALSSSQQQNTQYQQLLSLIGGGIGFALPNGLSSLPKIPGT